MLRDRRTLPWLLAVAALAACTAIKLTYNHLDWLVQFQLRRYVDLEAAQKQEFEERFREFWSWHRGTQLKLYVGDLRELAGRVDQPLTLQQVDQYFTRSRDHLARAMREAVPDTARMLADLDDAQVAELVENLNQKRRKSAAESADLTQEKLRERSAANMTDNLKRWIGSLSREQKARVRQWAAARQYAGTILYQYQDAWMSAFTKLLAHRRDPDFEQRLGDLFGEPRVPYGEAMQKVQDHNRTLLFGLLADLSTLLSAEQRAHLRKRLNELAADLEELSAQQK